jgi:hypothetical protein
MIIGQPTVQKDLNRCTTNTRPKDFPELLVVNVKLFPTEGNQNSMPTLSNKVLMPGMVHESPYVKNFQKDQEPIELKRHRLKLLNNQLKDLSKNK